MSEGYKVTELGDIPEDWVVVRLESVGRIISGGTPDTKTEYYWGGGVPWCTPTDITALKGKKYISLTARTISEEGIQNSSATLLPPGSLVVCTRATIGDCAISQVELATNQGFKSIIPNVNSDVNFLYYLVRTMKSEMVKLSSGSTFLEISKKAFENIKISLPPLPEQQKIASILSTVDEKIEIIDAQISQTQELKKGLMQQLLSKGIGHTKFKSSELGDIPESWEVVKLDSHIQLLSGFAFQSGKFNEDGQGTRLLRGINITVGKLRFNDKIDKYWNEPFQEFEKYALNAGDLVIAMDGSLVGKNYAKVEEKHLPLLLVQRVARIRTKPSLSSEFLHQIVGSPSFLKYSDSVKTSSGIPHISAKNIKDFKIPFPTRIEQNKISSILNAVDEKLQSLDNRKEIYNQLKKGLMQQLLTGKIRVNTSQNEPALA